MLAARRWSSDEASTLENVLLVLSFVIEPALLLVVMLSGLNKVDFYHLGFLAIFVGYLALPKRRRGVTQILVVYSAIFIAIKHVYVLAGQDFSQNTRDFLEAMGFTTTADPSAPWSRFFYKFYAQQWAVLAVGYL